MNFVDKNLVKVEDRSIINLHQTVNGSNLFVVADLNNLDLRYHDDLTIRYEYDVVDLLKPDRYGIVEYEVIGQYEGVIPDVVETEQTTEMPTPEQIEAVNFLKPRLSQFSISIEDGKYYEFMDALSTAMIDFARIKKDSK